MIDTNQGQHEGGAEGDAAMHRPIQLCRGLSLPSARVKQARLGIDAGFSDQLRAHEVAPTEHYGRQCERHENRVDRHDQSQRNGEAELEQVGGD
jgi:hypothetical protein